MTSHPPTIRALVDAARLVAADPSGENIAVLLEAAFEARFDEMPREYLDRPFPRDWSVTESVGDRFRNVATTSDQRSD